MKKKACAPQGTYRIRLKFYNGNGCHYPTIVVETEEQETEYGLYPIREEQTREFTSGLFQLLKDHTDISHGYSIVDDNTEKELEWVSLEPVTQGEQI